MWWFRDITHCSQNLSNPKMASNSQISSSHPIFTLDSLSLQNQSERQLPSSAERWCALVWDFTTWMPHKVVLKRRQWGKQLIISTPQQNPSRSSKESTISLQVRNSSSNLGPWWFGINMHMGRLQESKTSAQSSMSVNAGTRWIQENTNIYMSLPSIVSWSDLYIDFKSNTFLCFFSLFLLRFQISTESFTPQTVQLSTFQYSSVVWAQSDRHWP